MTSTSAGLVARHLNIRGIVQGVMFRASMATEAERLGVTGWVRNRRDGSVEALVQGPADTVAKITEWARHGPPRARVTAVEITEADSEPFVSFEQRPTA